ncbi:dimethyladenosine transferase [Dietzia sp. HMSC21D01]|uniref:SRPBCC family protein n=1 Tax=Dietzia cinnamea TaxID=321318 RepID=A0AAW5QC43_9ACTN|nr:MULTISPECIES: SRPBCC family protein [Dietzia]MCT1864540.1 SRPBCC family protein [Dietzia cinnamea]MCT2030610.1 SRPBCC family protein [Dietzia cinnamea]MCT2033379.1 SRPBCC family protein [Dietzia cinnamea]MCT2077998.1 SRPBCC family protein [Dietzia cinnamea]MCT2106286.1 SRPBCC family protein [Dietzia cinnamea]
MTAISTIDRGPRVVARSVTVNAPADELFALLNDPRKHGLVDGSGTVRDNVRGPTTLRPGAKFTTAMRMYGVPYRITCTVTEHRDTPVEKVIEWAHPAGHRWRWELIPTGNGKTKIVESFDNRPSKLGRFFEIVGMSKRNAAGITETLSKLAARYETAG